MFNIVIIIIRVCAVARVEMNSDTIIEEVSGGDIEQAVTVQVGENQLAGFRRGGIVNMCAEVVNRTAYNVETECIGIFNRSTIGIMNIISQDYSHLFPCFEGIDRIIYDSI